MNRRKALKLLGQGTAAAALAGLYAWRIEPYWVEFVERDLPIRHLPPDLEGKTLLQISDIHIGDRVDYAYIINAFKQAGTLQPDIVVYTGDYVSYDSAKQLDQLREVLQHAVTGTLGTVAILGNHDYGKDWVEDDVCSGVVAALRESGISVLRNEAASVSGLTIIGLDDLWGSNFAPDTAMAHYQPGEASLVLCHNPDVCDLDVWNGYQGWILAGHTHGGQCKPPFLPPPLLPVKNRTYTAGEFSLKDGRKLYINRALGCSYPVRFNVRPEITVFTLREAANA